MNSLAAKAACVVCRSPSSCNSTIIASCRPNLCYFSVSFPRRTKKNGKQRLALTVKAYDSSNKDSSNSSGDSKPPNGTVVLLSSTLPLSPCRICVYYFSC